MIDALHRLPTPSLRALARSLREGPLSSGPTNYFLAQLAGAEAPAVKTCLELLASSGMSQEHAALLIESVATARVSVPDPALLFDLVLSGPDVPGVPTADTGAAVHSLVQQAREEIFLIGYAVHNASRIFEPVALGMRENPTLKACLFLDIGRGINDTSLDSEIVRRYIAHFRERSWPWEERPNVYYDPRSLSTLFQSRSALHAKCVVVDRKHALITSANFTEAAQERNIEAGVLIHYAPLAERIARYFEGLVGSGQLEQCAF